MKDQEKLRIVPDLNEFKTLQQSTMCNPEL
jgi:hypothetical protein